jgi:hypothetical protein
MILLEFIYVTTAAHDTLKQQQNNKQGCHN